ncbi:hypothetical protein J3R83DRAFT_1326 [Lanmaoa asiatica]|nr:hypothetical protein J3R83DRAFT_1326 [Lanmaoa asiatica]
MVFGLFNRKSTLDDASIPPDSKKNYENTRFPTPTPSIASVAHHSPLRFQTVFHAMLGGSTTDLTLKDSDLATDNVAGGGNNDDSPAPPPPVTPSPPPVGSNETKALYDLMRTIPPKTLHAYTLTHLCPQPPLSSTSMSTPVLGLHPENTPRPPSPNTVTKLTAFFSTLAPPPLLHCVRCHKDFYDIENEEKDKACRVAHDDESALVSRVSGGGYETLWGCCGQTASGDGSEGPPDGWCYEGRHTVSSSLRDTIHIHSNLFDYHQTDVKRARFRADSTIQDDKLTSCLKLNCHRIRDQLPRRDSHTSPFRNVGTSSARKSNPSPARSQASVLISRSARKRPRKSLKEVSGSENEADGESLVGRIVKAKDKEKVSGGAGEADEDTSMRVDKPNLPPRSKALIKSRPISQAHPPPSTSTTIMLPISGSKVTPMGSTKARTTAAKPKTTSRTLLSQSHTHLASDSEASTRSRPRTRSHVREESRVRDASRSRTASKLMKADVSARARRARRATKPVSQSPTSDDEPEAETR